MDKSQKHAVPNEVINAIDQLDEKNAKGYLYDIFSIIQRNQQDSSEKLYEEMDTLLQELIHSQFNKQKHSNTSNTYQSNSSIPRRRLNLPLAKVGLSHGQQRLRAENERILRNKRKGNR
ncbi:hypothetical protein [Virgibacillus sp. L01]|uniref:hypothetical protein n=1 Tax=Virgibacillus sp. L01 TaxID=3457429 RepID=UPI003FD12607